MDSLRQLVNLTYAAVTMNMERKEKVQFDRKLASLQVRFGRRQQSAGHASVRGDMTRLFNLMGDAQ